MSAPDVTEQTTPRRPARWGRRILVALLAVMAVAVAGVVWLGTSTGAVRWLAGQAEQRVPGLRLDGLAGSLAGGVQVANLHWAGTDGAAVHLTAVAVTARPLALLRGTLAIETLSVGTISVTPGTGAPPPTESQSWPDVRHPGTLQVDQWSLGTLSWSPTDGSGVVVWTSLEGEDLRSDANGVSVSQFVLQAPTGQARGELSLEPFGNWTARARVEGEVHVAPAPPVDLTLALDGALGGVWTGLVTAQTADPAAGQVRIALSGTDLRQGLAAEIDAALTEGILSPWWPDAPTGMVAGEATLRWTGGATWQELQAAVRWQDLAWQDWQSAAGEAKVGGVPEAWTLEVRGRLRPPTDLVDGPALEASAIATGDQHRLTASSWTLVSPQGQAEGTLEAAWEKGWQVAARGTLSGLNPGQWQPEAEGLISGRGNVEAGSMAAGAPVTWSVELTEIDGLWRGQPLRGSALVAGEQAQLQQVDVQGEIGEVKVAVKGTAVPAWDLTWSVQAPDLSVLQPTWGGNLASEGRLRGQASAPELVFTLEGEDLRGFDVAIEQVSGRGELATDRTRPRAATFALRGLRWQDRTADTLRLEVGEEGSRTLIGLEAAGPGWTGAATVVGEGDHQQWAGELRSATWAGDAFGQWSLAAPAAWAWTPTTASLTGLQAQRDDGGGTVSASGAWDAAVGLDARLEMVALPWATLAPWLPVGLIYEGDGSGWATVVWPVEGAPTIRGEGRSGPGSWQQTVGEKQMSLLQWHSANVAGTYLDGWLDTQVAVALVDGGSLRGQARLALLDRPGQLAAAEPMTGRLEGSFSDFDLLPVLVPELGTVSGRGVVDLTLTGTRSDPVVAGTLVLEEGLATLPRWGLRLTQLGLSLQGTPTGIAWQATAQSGPGEATVQGNFTRRSGRWSGRATLSGENFEVANLPEAQIRVTPKLDLVLDDRHLQLTGTVAVPWGRLRPLDRAGAVTVSEDEVIVGGPPPRPLEERWLLQAEVTLSLGDVTFTGYGLTGKVAGKITAVDRPDQLTRATGELRIEDGKYSAWGQKLEIERGRLLFSGGPVSQPGLDIRAVRENEQVVVGVNVRGTLQEPELRLFSEPAMPNSELLSWLVLGRPLAQASGAQQMTLSNTANAAGLAGGNLLLKQLGRRLGVGEVGIERGDDPEQAAVVIGRYLSPRLYVAYGLGIFDPTSMVRLRFQLSRRWTIEAEAGDRATSTDLRYSIERD